MLSVPRATLRVVRRSWAVGALVALAAFGGSMAALVLMPKSYTATTVVAVTPKPGTSPAADLLRLALPSYTYLATSPATAEDLAHRLELDPQRVQNGISASSPPQSNTLLLGATWSDPETAARLANELGAEVQQATDSDPLLTATPVAPALPPAGASWPPWRAGIIAGAILSLALGGLVAFRLRRRRPPESSIERLMKLIAGEGLSTPVLVAGPQAGDGAVLVADFLEKRLAGHRDAGIPRLLIPAVGGGLRYSGGLGAGAAAALARRGHRVLLCVDEGEATVLDQPGIREQLARTGTGTVITGSSLPGTGRLLDREGWSTPGTDADVVVHLTIGVGQSGKWVASDDLVGVIPVVAPEASGREVQVTLRSLTEHSSPVLAVLHKLPPRIFGESRPSASRHSEKSVGRPPESRRPVEDGLRLWVRPGALEPEGPRSVQ